jgi:hypothetical protein
MPVERVTRASASSTFGAESPSFNTALNDILFAILNTLLGKVPKSFVLRSVGSFPEGSDPDD